eukprot:CAMPEP_0171433572 /NCGR_PEP_ID=MMETSP0881-20121228/8612_1 /TAXON_ID=67004 /ORGANISM="Thalassiosira weissflogii, Strain CCMP1336" /LENGTH=35 /DNA_ID= /DNA_START= /DNA_END= /DNA_ORIENTATION=
MEEDGAAHDDVKRMTRRIADVDSDKWSPLWLRLRL